MVFVRTTGITAGPPAVITGSVTPSSSSTPVVSSPLAKASSVGENSVSTDAPKRRFALTVLLASAIPSQSPKSVVGAEMLTM